MGFFKVAQGVILFCTFYSTFMLMSLIWMPIYIPIMWVDLLLPWNLQSTVFKCHLQSTRITIKNCKFYNFYGTKYIIYNNHFISDLSINLECYSTCLMWRLLTISSSKKGLLIIDGATKVWHYWKGCHKCHIVALDVALKANKRILSTFVIFPNIFFF